MYVVRWIANRIKVVGVKIQLTSVSRSSEGSGTPLHTCSLSDLRSSECGASVLIAMQPLRGLGVSLVEGKRPALQHEIVSKDADATNPFTVGLTRP